MAILSPKADPIASIPNSSSKQEEWINWHKALKSNFGTQNANSLWVKAWKKFGSPEANTGDLRTYLKSQGITIDSSKWDSIVDAGAGVTDFIGSYFHVAKYFGIGLGIIVVGGLGMIVYNLAKNPAQNAGIAARAFVTKGK